VRSTVVGVDEIQTVTTTCDEVVNEVQRVTTSAVDIDEVQEVEIVTSVINEVQLVQSYTADVPEIQVLEISAPYVAAVQSFGIILSSVDTSSCTEKAACSTVTAALSGKIRLFYNPFQCGTGGEENNFCLAAISEDNQANSTLFSTDAVPGYSNGVDFMNTTDIRNALCSLAGMGQNCVTISVNSTTIRTHATLGEYMHRYLVTFTGKSIGRISCSAVQRNEIMLGITVRVRRVDEF
jgi:hypothetical protein